MNILVVDDEALERKAIIHKISSLLPNKVHFHEAANGSEAITLSKFRIPDLVFMDIKMPGISGLDAARAIIKINAKTQIVIVSAYGEFKFAQEAIRIGVKNYLLKPVEKEVLSELIAQLQSSQETKLPIVTDKKNEDFNHSAINFAVKYIQENYFRELTMEYIASKVFLNPSYFSRLFKQKTNFSFCEYVTLMRIEEAKKLLVDTTYPVNLIGQMIGFNDARYFAQIFKQKEEVTPSQYRELSLKLPPKKRLS